MLARLLVSAESVGSQPDKLAGCRTEPALPDGNKQKKSIKCICAVKAGTCRANKFQLGQ